MNSEQVKPSAELLPCPFGGGKAEREVVGYGVFSLHGTLQQVVHTEGDREYYASCGGLEVKPLYTAPIAAIPVTELQAMCERWTDEDALCGSDDCADELRALIAKYVKE